MDFDCQKLMNRIRAHPDDWCTLLPPCFPKDIAEVEKRLRSEISPALSDMLQCFNSAEFFIAAIPLLTFFPVSNIAAHTPPDWAAGWYVDEFTAKWRADSAHRDQDWAVAITNYGGLILFDAEEHIKEWDINESRFIIEQMPFEQWIEKVFAEGEAMMRELS